MPIRRDPIPDPITEAPYYTFLRPGSVAGYEGNLLGGPVNVSFGGFDEARAYQLLQQVLGDKILEITKVHLSPDLQTWARVQLPSSQAPYLRPIHLADTVSLGTYGEPGAKTFTSVGLVLRNLASNDVNARSDIRLVGMDSGGSPSHGSPLVIFDAPGGGAGSYANGRALSIRNAGTALYFDRVGDNEAEIADLTNLAYLTNAGQLHLTANLESFSYVKFYGTQASFLANGSSAIQYRSDIGSLYWVPPSSLTPREIVTCELPNTRGAVPVAKTGEFGGSGLTLFGAVAPSAANQVLAYNGTDTVFGAIAPSWISGAARGSIIVGNSTPAWAAYALGASGKVLRSDGTDLLYSTFTIPDTITQNSLLYASAANVLASTGTALTFDGTVLSTGYLDIGNVGTEAAGINVNGTTYESVGKFSDIGGSNEVLVHLHRHATGISPILLFSRSNSDTSSHGVVTTGQGLGQVYAVGWTGSHYDIGALISMVVGAGTVSSTSMPGKIILATTADGAQTPTDALTIDSNQVVALANALPVTSGGTGLASCSQGDLFYGSASNTISALAKDANATRYLSNTGTDNNPAWAQVNLTNGVTGDLPFANLAQGSALSVLGVTGNATADVASIAAGTDHQVLRRSGTALEFGAVNLAQSAAVTGVLPVGNWSVLTTKGDLVAYTTTTTRLGVGSDTHVLTADSTQASGIKWAAVSGGGGTLDYAYDYGGAGAGRTITVDSGAVTCSTSSASTDPVFEITQASTGDAAMRYALGSSRSYAVGIDNSASDAFVISTAASATAVLGTGNLVSVSTAGVMTLAAALPIASGGTNATSFTTSNGLVKYDGTSLVTGIVTDDGSTVTAAVSSAATTPQLALTQASTGDSAFRFALGSARSYAVGIDNSASDAFVISTAASGTAVLGTTNLLSMATDGTITLTTALGVASGGTGLTTCAQGDLLYGSATATLARLAKDTNATRYLSNTGSSNNPAWAQVELSNGVTGDLPYANLTQASAASRLLGRGSASGAGDWQEMTVGSGLSISGTVLSASGAGAGWVKLSSASASSSATVDFGNNFSSTYKAYAVVITKLIPATDNTVLWCRLSDDAGVSFEADASDYIWAHLRMSLSTTSGTASSGDTEIQLTGTDGIGNATGESGSFVVYIHNPNSASAYQSIDWHSSYEEASGSLCTGHGSGQLQATTNVEGIRFLMSSGNITSGEFELYGIV